MAYRNFTVGDLRGLKVASTENLPNMVAISGPNGSGKSALLEMLWSQRGRLTEPGTDVLYVGPHRTWRSSQLSDISVRGFNHDFSDVLRQENIPNFQYTPPGGLNWLPGVRRLGSSADDSRALVKTAIVRIQNRVSTLLTEEFQKQGNQIAPGTVPDLLGPLSELVSILLPHLELVGVDSGDQNDVRVNFRRRDLSEVDAIFDIDNLSSGEKSAIALFLPFIERQVKRLSGAAELPPEGITPTTLLIDEPEIHLHPNLQLNVLEYMRTFASQNEAQFIITTHSPTLLDAFEPGELYVLNFSSAAPDNQLVRLADTAEHLEVARSVTGSTHLLTRSKPIVFIEGEPDSGAQATDERIIKILIPEAKNWAIVPSHGKHQVIASVRNLIAAEISLPGFPVFGLVDSDQGQMIGQDTVIEWPVAMFENLLLDPEVIRSVIEPYNQSPHLKTMEDVRRSLGEIVAERREDEVRLRIKDDLPSGYLRPVGRTTAQLETSANEQYQALLQEVTALKLEELIERAEEEVRGIEEAETALERFHGKSILKAFFTKHNLSSSGFSWNVFVTELARTAVGTERCSRLSGQSAKKIKLYFPPGLDAFLSEGQAGGEYQELAEKCLAHRRKWEEGDPQMEGRNELRSDLIAVSRQWREAARAESAKQLLDLAVSIGTD